MLQRESIGGVESLLGLDGNVGLHTCAFPIRSRHRVSRFPPGMSAMRWLPTRWPSAGCAPSQVVLLWHPRVAEYAPWFPIAFDRVRMFNQKYLLAWLCGWSPCRMHD